MPEPINPITALTRASNIHYSPYQASPSGIRDQVAFQQMLNNKENTEYLNWANGFLGANPHIPSSLKETIQNLASFEKGVIQRQFATAEELQSELRKALRHFSNVITHRNNFLEDGEGYITRILPDPRELARMEETKVAEIVSQFLQYIQKIDERPSDFAVNQTERQKTLPSKNDYL